MKNRFDLQHMPTEIRLKQEEKILEVDFDDGSSFQLPAELLRVESPSAEVQGHSPAEKKIIGGRRHVGILSVEAVGNYAVKIAFDDLHDTGLYSWDLLYDFGRRQDEIWQTYLQNLEAEGLSRDP
ncbi:MAG: DUF971 domain-containing protein [Rhodospirillales bacterium]|nr:DUF971 domain-containing protein [Rhodospirillales bacterium]